jgi:hypothetical protein
MSLSIIIPAAISTEILQLTTKLFDKLRTQNPDIKLIIDFQSFQFININNENQTVEDNTQIIPEEKDDIYMDDFEQEIINGIMKASAGPKASYPPKLTTNADALIDYNELFSYTHYSTTSLHYEIGRILTEMTTGTRTQRMTDAQRIFRRCVADKNIKQRVALSFRIYNYFRNNSHFINCRELDQLFFPGNIGKISHRTSDNLQKHIEDLFEFVSNISKVALENLEVV